VRGNAPSWRLADTLQSLTDRFRIAKEITASLGSVSVLGFSFSRRTIKEAASYRPKPFAADEMYKHPDRQVTKLDFIDAVNKLVGRRDISKAGSVARFNTKHDVYSLGVVLLEVGLWRKLEDVIPKIQELDPEDKKTKLRDAAKDLKNTMGSKYAWIVEQCLEVEDPEDVTAQQVLEYLEDLVM
jgi:hypothetical protein